VRRPLTLVVAFVLAGCGWLGPVPAEVTDVEFGAEAGVDAFSPVVEVASGEVDGETWAVVASRDGDGQLCLGDLFARQVTGMVCGPRPGVGLAPVSPTVIPSGERILLYGGAAPDVRRVVVEWAAGAVEAPVVTLERLGIGERAFALLLPPGIEPTRLVARDGDGRDVGALELGPIVLPEPVP
jgi:hypothetical protein